jgi:diguanylate cyclase (GGDEF)-like protein
MMPPDTANRDEIAPGRRFPGLVAPGCATNAATPVQPRRAGIGVAPAAIALACALLAPRSHAAEPPPAASMHTARYQPVDELERLEYLARSQPNAAVVELRRFADAMSADDPRRLEAMMEIGVSDVTLALDDDLEQVARRIETLASGTPLARPAAMLLRAQWLDANGDVSRAERQVIEATALFPPDTPAWLHILQLSTTGHIKLRGGRYDEAMISYNEALRLVDATGPAWQRVDVRLALGGTLLDAGQPDRALEINRELMQLAGDAGDDLGLSHGYTLRAIVGHDRTTPAQILSDWRAALEHARLAGNLQQLSLTLANVADYYLSQGDYQTAYDMSTRALPLAREIKDPRAEKVALANAGLALIGLKRKEEGIGLVHQSIALNEHSGSPRYAANVADELGGTLEKAGYLPDAVEAYHQYRQIADGLNQQDRQRAVIELQEGFANQRRQHELDMLGREGRLKDEELLHRTLEMKLWAVAGVSALLLLAALASFASRLRMRNRQLSDSNEQLRIQAEVDPLTGVANRHHLHGIMASQPGRGFEGTLYLIDLDNFKQINDRCGHAGGDAVLVEIARRLRAVVRDEDLVVRWGGEEFLALVRSLPASGSELLAQRLLATFTDAPVVHEGQPLRVSASIGYAAFPIRSGPSQANTTGNGLEVDWERAIALVDSAMYLAKASGRNGACAIRGVAPADAVALDEIGSDLEAAWHDGRVDLHFQQGPSLKEATA